MARRPIGSFEAAEAAFKAVTAKPTEAPERRANVIPPGRETVSLKLDNDVLAFFQDDGPGWQERINAALRKAAGL